MVRVSPYLHDPPSVNTLVSRPFLASDIRTIYNFPAVPTTNVYIGVIGLGGTLTGTVNPFTGILTGGDVQAYWTSIGIAPANHPVVRIVKLGGSNLNPTDINSTIENTIDVEMVGACCPTSKLTIIFYLYDQYSAPANVDAFYGVFNSAINTPVTINGVTVKPSVISCSWGASENLFSNSMLTMYDTLFASAKAAGITITCAAGNNGSSNGTSGTITDFPSSSPNVVSCGGTHLVCPNKDANGNYIYTGATETTWSFSGGTGTGGGVSNFFNGPPYPRLGSLKRQSPDVALVAAPATGVQWRVNGADVVYGGTSIVAPAIAGLLACTGSPAKSLISKLYALPSTAFNDILIGTNGAYTASTGYDNCSGLGSINGTVFVPSLAALVANPVTTMSISGNLTINTGSTTQLTAVTNANAANKSATWHSSSGLATVSSTGLVRGISAGNVTITATTLDGYFSSSVTVSISTPPPPPPPPAPNMIISTTHGGPAITSFTMRRNTLVVLYSNIPLTTWTSSISTIATVRGGIVFARVTKGRVTITARYGSQVVPILVTVQ